ncbi:hypothetical protein [Paracoccus aerius]|uniref:hypothetical protein n=1 Tax=Paracoccus aerius TaxID=1915382 RepID=UPI00174943F0|nr:hypothetical protein [Paracoccus aerius]GHG11583.1 hypothetical protein GCM10017322_03970 [Paracoccus aerius]
MISMIAVLSWPVVVFWLFASRPPAAAVTAAIVGAYLLLPRNFSIELPAVPSLDKDSIPALAAVLAAATLARPMPHKALAPGMVLPGLWPRSRMLRILLVMMLAGAVATILTNGDTLRYGPIILPALRPYDAASFLGITLFTLLPFLLARKYLAHPVAQRTLLIGLVVAGLLYSLPALYEVRFSPQLSRDIYGYFPHDWRQHLRAGGFRPVVFLHHGLWLAIFFCGSLLASLALWRSSSGKDRMRWLVASSWLFMTLVLSKGVGALGIGLLLGAIIVFLPVRLQVIGASALAATLLVFPMLRGADMVPTDTALILAEGVDPDRAASLRYRFDNEDILLDKANDRPVFGWGGWGRNRVFDSEGEDLSVTDGYWVIVIGTQGWVGYLAQFGLLLLPMIFLGMRWKQLALTPETAGLTLALTANMIDLIPNATLTPVTWLLAGALAGRLELGRITDTVGQLGPAEPGHRSAYTRQTRRHPAQTSALREG